MDLHALESAARRILLEDVASQVQRGERGHAARGPGAHAVGVIDAGVQRDHADVTADLHEPHRLTRNTHADFDVRTDAHPFDERSERLDQGPVALVTAVEPYLVPEQAGRDADSNFFHPRSRYVMISTRAPSAASATLTGVIAGFAPNAVRHSATAAVPAASSVT